MSGIKVELIGMDKLIGILARGGAEAVPALAQALVAEANLAFRVSQRQVPFRTGVLKGSGRVDGPQLAGTNVNVEISYGGAARAYAWIMHRGTMYGHAINYRNGKKANYLSDPVNAQLAGLDSRVARRIERILGA